MIIKLIKIISITLFKDKNKLTFSESKKLVSKYYLKGDFHFNKQGHDLIFKEILNSL